LFLTSLAHTLLKVPLYFSLALFLLKLLASFPLIFVIPHPLVTILCSYPELTTYTHTLKIHLGQHWYTYRSKCASIT
jgi:hypothetical protein